MAGHRPTGKWLSAAGLPLAILIVGVGLRLIFHTWPQLDVFGAVAAIGYIAVRGRCWKPGAPHAAQGVAEQILYQPGSVEILEPIVRVRSSSPARKEASSAAHLITGLASAIAAATGRRPIGYGSRDVGREAAQLRAD